MCVVIGTPESAERLVLGRYEADGVLPIARSIGELKTAQRRELREHLASQAGRRGEPSLADRDLSPAAQVLWGGGQQLIHRIEPPVVIEIVTDRSTDRSPWRHVTRYVRVRTGPRPR